MAAVFEKTSLLQRILPLFRGFDLPLLFVVLLLAGAGLVAMYSAGYDHGTRFVDHGRNMLIAGTILFVVAQVPPQRIMAFAVPLYAAGVVLLLAVALFGITKKGAQRWVNLGIVIQPSEILKIAMPLMLAWWFQKREGQLRPLDFVAAGALLAVPVGLIMKQPDLGTSLLVLAAGLSVIFFAGLSWKLVLPPVVLGGIGIALIVWFEPQLCADGVRWPSLPQVLVQPGNRAGGGARALDRWRIGLAGDVQTDFAGTLLALLVAQDFEPDDEIDFARAVAEIHIAEVALVHQLEIL